MIKKLLVSVDTAPSCAARVGWAASLAEACGATLEGIAAAQPTIPVFTPFGEELLVLQPEVQKAMRQQAERALSDAGEVFRAACPQGRFRPVLGEAADAVLTRHARGADLVVVGRRGPDDAADLTLGIAPADIVLTLGRPLIVVPPGATGYSNARVLLSWKDGREARRALRDALPLLSGADEIVLCTIGEEASAGELGEIIDYLAAHGISAKPLVEQRGRRTDSEALLDVARRIDATLIVAGAFGHSRLKQWVFGGVTRDLLAAAPVPCLFSH